MDVSPVRTPDGRTAAHPTEHFLNVDGAVIGRTVSTKHEPNTSSRFLFWLASPEQNELTERLQVGDIIAARSDGGDDVTFGVVVEMRSYSDVDSFIADYLSHDFGKADVEIPTDVSQVVVVTCDVMRNLSGVTRPVGRSRVYFPSAVGIQFSYGIIDRTGQNVFSGEAIPIGLFENGDGTTAQVAVDEDFLIGPDGAHMNVSGISGLASKTSAVQFVLKSLFEKSGKRVAAVLINVKSRDLLYIDQPNPRLLGPEGEWSRRAYETLEISPGPFDAVRFFAPEDPRRPGRTLTTRSLPTEAFAWDLSMIRYDIPSYFSGDDWDEKMDGVWFRITEAIDDGEIVTYAQMDNWIERVIATAGNNSFPRGQHIATWNKMRARLRGFASRMPGVIRTAGNGIDIPWRDLGNRCSFVIDIEMLEDNGKRLVFGRVMRSLSRRMSGENRDLDAIVVFVDELNKYAPSGNVRSPLKSRIVDITARGRSIGLILFGAEQFASSVEREVVENSSTYLIGRTESTELRAANYAMLSSEIKTKIMSLPQGQLLARFSKFPQPVFLRFPYPPCVAGDQYRPPDEDAAPAT